MIFKKLVIITGHYGSGKTNFAINLALEKVRQGRKVTIMDLDIVNPYFRTTDYRKILEENNIKVISSDFASSTLDVPALSPLMSIAFEESDSDFIVDVGGDDAGAMAMGRFANKINAIKDCDILYVANCFRKLVSTPELALEIMREIESASRIKMTGIVNNSHLCSLTTVDDIINSLGYANELSRISALPLICTTAKKELAEDPKLKENISNLFGVDIHVKMPW